MKIVFERDSTFVTNNRFNFLTHTRRGCSTSDWWPLCPNMIPMRQRELLNVALNHVGSRELINTVIEINSRHRDGKRKKKYEDLRKGLKQFGEVRRGGGCKLLIYWLLR